MLYLVSSATPAYRAIKQRQVETEVVRAQSLQHTRLMFREESGLRQGQFIPEVQPAPPTILADGAHFDVDEGQHGQRGDDLKDHCGNSVGLPHKLSEGQACLLILRQSKALSHTRAKVAPAIACQPCINLHQAAPRTQARQCHSDGQDWCRKHWRAEAEIASAHQACIKLDYVTPCIHTG